LECGNLPYVCIVDADSVLERDALLRIMLPIMADSETRRGGWWNHPRLEWIGD